MALSRTVPGLVLAFGSVPADALPPIDYRLPAARPAPLRMEIRPDCPAPSSDQDIVVCGRREDERYRVPPSAHVPQAADRAGGEQMEALAANPGRCGPVGPNQQCTSGVDIFAIIFGVLRLVQRARANRD